MSNACQSKPEAQAKEAPKTELLALIESPKRNIKAAASHSRSLSGQPCKQGSYSPQLPARPATNCGSGFAAGCTRRFGAGLRLGRKLQPQKAA